MIVAIDEWLYNIITDGNQWTKTHVQWYGLIIWVITSVRHLTNNDHYLSLTDWLTDRCCYYELLLNTINGWQRLAIHTGWWFTRMRERKREKETHVQRTHQVATPVITIASLHSAMLGLKCCFSLGFSSPHLSHHPHPPPTPNGGPRPQLMPSPSPSPSQSFRSPRGPLVPRRKASAAHRSRCLGVRWWQPGWINGCWVGHQWLNWLSSWSMDFWEKHGLNPCEGLVNHDLNQWAGWSIHLTSTSEPLNFWKLRLSHDSIGRWVASPPGDRSCPSTRRHSPGDLSKGHIHNEFMIGKKSE